MKSYREIASDLNGTRSHVTFRAWMRKDFPKLFEQMRKVNEEQPHGGLPERPPEDPANVLYTDGHSALQALRSAALMFTPAQRGETIEILAATLEAFRELPFVVPEF